MAKLLKNLDYQRFFQLIPERKTAIAASSTEKPKTDYPVNLLAAALHPSKQELIVSEVTELDQATRSYRLIPNQKKGTIQCAYFSAGQYLSISLMINESPVTRPYSISSSPQDSLKGFYVLTVKKAPGAFASDYILKNWTVGTEVTASEPMGTFCYEKLRDAKHVIAVAGGSGITPFLSMAKAIAEGEDDFRMTLLYGSRTKESILYREELNDLAKQSGKINIIHVLSHEDTCEDGFEHGFITADILRKYLSEENNSIFISGPTQMYRFLEPEIQSLHLEKKWIRYELCAVSSPSESYPDYPEGQTDKVYSGRVFICGREYLFPCAAEESVLVSMEKAHIQVPSRCRGGECSYCHARLISGNVYVPENMDYRRMADYDFGNIHPCCTFPISDISLEI